MYIRGTPRSTNRPLNRLPGCSCHLIMAGQHFIACSASSFDRLGYILLAVPSRVKGVRKCDISSFLESRKTRGRKDSRWRLFLASLFLIPLSRLRRHIFSQRATETRDRTEAVHVNNVLDIYSRL